MTTAGFRLKDQQRASSAAAIFKMPPPPLAFADLLAKFSDAVWKVNNGTTDRFHHPSLTVEEVGMTLAKTGLDATEFLSAYLAAGGSMPIVAHFLAQCEHPCGDCRGKPAAERLACALRLTKPLTLNHGADYVALRVDRIPAGMTQVAQRIFAAHPDGARLAAVVAADVEAAQRYELSQAELRANTERAAQENDLAEFRRLQTAFRRFGWDGAQPLEKFLAELQEVVRIACGLELGYGYRTSFDALCSRVTLAHGANVLKCATLGAPEGSPPSDAPEPVSGRRRRLG